MKGIKRLKLKNYLKTRYNKEHIIHALGIKDLIYIHYVCVFEDCLGKLSLTLLSS
jgi:hypothetical protein